MRTIALDCGASFIKAALFEDGTLLHQFQVPAPSIRAKDAETKQISELVCLAKDIVLDLAAGEKEICLGLSNEMHGFLLAYENGEPYTDYISWQKEYGNIPVDGETASSSIKKLARGGIWKITGMPVRAGLPSCNLMYLSRTGALEKAEGEMVFYTLGDYLLYRLTGTEPSVHPTNAAGTGLYNIYQGTWDGGLINSVTNGHHIRFLRVGEDAFEGRLGSVTIHAVPAVGDQQAALLGAGLSNERSLSFNIGTGGQTAVLTDPKEAEGDYQVRPFFDGKFIRTVPHIPSGRALNVYLRFVKDILRQFHVEYSDVEIWERLLSAADAGEDTHLSCDLSFFENAVSEHAVGSITNIGEYELNLGALMRAVLKQIADNYVLCADRIAGDKKDIEEIIFSGGVAKRIQFIRERILSHYGDKVSVTVAENETLKGINSYITKACFH